MPLAGPNPSVWQFAAIWANHIYRAIGIRQPGYPGYRGKLVLPS